MEHNLPQRFDNLTRQFQGGVQVIQNMEIVDAIKKGEFSTDEIMFLSALGVVAVAALLTAANKIRKSKASSDNFVFEADTEACPVPAKMQIKSTLKGIMAKNNA